MGGSSPNSYFIQLNLCIWLNMGIIFFMMRKFILKEVTDVIDQQILIVEHDKGYIHVQI